jgi:hypothetical protein
MDKNYKDANTMLRAANIFHEDLIYDKKKKTYYSLLRYTTADNGNQWINLNNIHGKVRRTSIDRNIDDTLRCCVFISIERNAPEVLSTIGEIERTINWNMVVQDTTIFGILSKSDQEKIIRDSYVSCLCDGELQLNIAPTTGLECRDIGDFRTNIFSPSGSMLTIDEVRPGMDVVCDILLNHVEFHNNSYYPMWYIQRVVVGNV